jgi:hypothetical protein
VEEKSDGNALLVRGTPGKGWRTERLPIGHACHIEEGPEALYLSDPLTKTLLVQREEAAPVLVPEETWAEVLTPEGTSAAG